MLAQFWHTVATTRNWHPESDSGQNASKCAAEQAPACLMTSWANDWWRPAAAAVDARAATSRRRPFAAASTSTMRCQHARTPRTKCIRTPRVHFTILRFGQLRTSKGRLRPTSSMSKRCVQPTLLLASTGAHAEPVSQANTLTTTTEEPTSAGFGHLPDASSRAPQAANAQVCTAVGASGGSSPHQSNARHLGGHAIKQLYHQRSTNAD